MKYNYRRPKTCFTLGVNAANTRLHHFSINFTTQRIHVMKSSSVEYMLVTSSSVVSPLCKAISFCYQKSEYCHCRNNVSRNALFLIINRTAHGRWWLGLVTYYLIGSPTILFVAETTQMQTDVGNWIQSLIGYVRPSCRFPTTAVAKQNYRRRLAFRWELPKPGRTWNMKALPYVRYAIDRRERGS